MELFKHMSIVVSLLELLLQALDLVVEVIKFLLQDSLLVTKSLLLHVHLFHMFIMTLLLSIRSNEEVGSSNLG